MTPMFCKTIGTGMNPSGIPGNIPKITMTAVISAICVISFAFIKINSPTLIFGTVSIMNFVNHHVNTG